MVPRRAWLPRRHPPRPRRTFRAPRPPSRRYPILVCPLPGRYPLRVRPFPRRFPSLRRNRPPLTQRRLYRPHWLPHRHPFLPLRTHRLPLCRPPGIQRRLCQPRWTPGCTPGRRPKPWRSSDSISSNSSDTKRNTNPSSKPRKKKKNPRRAASPATTRKRTATVTALPEWVSSTKSWGVSAASKNGYFLAGEKGRKESAVAPWYVARTVRYVYIGDIHDPSRSGSGSGTFLVHGTSC
mmetsp:Transcript_6838/g.17165  ORF Transcript_6838/g.17165 Transcript_6838/m.17165 type:complete len:237 (+) Transcript_6838:626-1336(+)